MSKFESVVRAGTGEALKGNGYIPEIVSLRGEKLQLELCKIFWREYKDTLTADDKKLVIHYAEMLEIFRAMLITNKGSVKNLTCNQSQPLQWYENFNDKKKRLISARTEFIQRFMELLNTKNLEVIKDQLNDVLNAYKKLLESHGVDFVKTEAVRRDLYNKFGGYEKGFYIKSISKRKQTQLTK